MTGMLCILQQESICPDGIEKVNAMTGCVNCKCKKNACLSLSGVYDGGSVNCRIQTSYYKGNNTEVMIWQIS